MRRLALARYWLAGGVLLCAAVLVALLVPQSALSVTFGFNDKLEHFLTFAAITGWFCGVFERRCFASVVLVLAIFAGLTELLQWLLTDDRHAEVADLVADLAGIAVAVVLALTGLDEWSAWIERRFGLEYRRTN